MSIVTGIETLCDSRGVVYRPTETMDELQDTVLVWNALAAPAGLNCRANQKWSGDLQDNGPGEQQGAQRQWFLVKDFDVQERDVIEVVSGPEAPVQLHVLSVTKLTSLLRPSVIHHIEVNVEVSHIDLTEPDMGSS